MAKSFSSDGGLIHFGANRFRVNGSGYLQLFLRSLDDVRNVQLVSINMQTLTDQEPLVLSNFTNQRAQLEIRTTNIDDVFNISKITIFVKQVATGLPQ